MTLECIESIFRWPVKASFEVIVVDNCSNDDSEKLITEKFPEVKWISNPENSGFGRGNNLGALQAKGQYLLFLNSDTIILKDTIETCLRHITSDPNIGVLGCKLQNEDLSVQKSTYSYTGDFWGVLRKNIILSKFVKENKGEIKAVMGAFMLIPLSVFKEVNGFDPDFFMYAEELDLCRRIQNKGYSVVYIESAAAIHKHGGSSKGGDWASLQTYLSDALLFLKAKGLAGYFAYHFLMHLNFISNFIVLWKMDKNYRRDFWAGQRMYFSNYFYYLQIPFLYSKSMGHGKRSLKRA